MMSTTYPSHYHEKRHWRWMLDASSILSLIQRWVIRNDIPQQEMRQVKLNDVNGLITNKWKIGQFPSGKATLRELSPNKNLTQSWKFTNPSTLSHSSVYSLSLCCKSNDNIPKTPFHAIIFCFFPLPSQTQARALILASSSANGATRSAIHACFSASVYCGYGRLQWQLASG